MRSRHETSFQILIVDDHPVLTQGLKQLLNMEKDFSVCGQCATGVETIRTLESVQPDLVILDLSLPDVNGLELLKQIRKCAPQSNVLVYTLHDETLYGERALRAGARGYVMKKDDPETVVTALRHILNGKMWVSSALQERALEMMGKPAGAIDAVDSLSDREFAVFQMIGQGMNTRSIADKLCVSLTTVNTYRTRIKQKLNLSQTSDLAQFATEWMHTNH